MSKDKHTPGPWYLEGDKLKGDRDIPIFAVIQGVASTGEHIEQHKHNMNLIMAAPKFLKACEAAKKFLEPELKEPGATVFWNLVNAIKEAKGE